MTDSSRIVLAPHSLAAEAYLLREIERLSPPAGAGDPATQPFGPPVRVVVPSHSLRQHLLARLAALRPAWLGVEISTLAGAAGAILRAAGEIEPRGGALLPILLERAAKRQRPLATAFGEFTDGWTALAATARDLVDAGFQPELAEALVERIEAERGAVPARTLDRARALIEVLARTLGELAELGLAPESTRLVRAAELAAQRGPHALPGGAFFLYGFADATGVASDLLEALVRHLGAVAILIDPLAGELDPDRFGARLRQRFEGAGGRGRVLVTTGKVEPTRWTLSAPTPTLEARALARAARAALDAGARPERVAIVARDLAAHRPALARELERRGVPFSASASSGPVTPTGHRAQAFLRLLRERGDVPVDAALELLDALPELEGGARAGVRLALRALGIARLRELTSIHRRDLERHEQNGFPLPARAGLEEADDGAERAPRRRLPVASLLAALDRLRALLDTVEHWPAVGPFSKHLARLRTLTARTGLERTEIGAALLAAATRPGDEVPAAMSLSAEEAFSLFAEAWRAIERSPWGGAGGGVQLLSVTEARGRTFERLFVASLERGSFPRPIADDPVLPDRLRIRLRDLLPDLPVKSEGHTEERFLFAQLTTSAPEVVLARAECDEAGKAVPRSSLLEALERDGKLRPFELADPAPEPALDRAVDAGVRLGGDAVAPHLAAVLEEGKRRFAPSARFDVGATSAARIRVLGELDADPTTTEGRLRIHDLGPYFGFLGASRAQAQSAESDESAAGLAIAATTLEAAAGCAWKAFLERTLKLEPIPDPLAALPTLDALLVGTAVHEALAALFPRDESAVGATVEALLDAPGRPLLWPPPGEVEQVALHRAGVALAEAGLGGRGLDLLLARRIVERLEVARAEDERRGPLSFLGAEVEGTCELPDGSGRATPIRFRADRLQREGERAVFVDWKTGKVGETLGRKKPETRRKHLLSEIASGRRLQSALYAVSAAPRPAEGRYVHLAPDDRAPERALGVEADVEVRTALAAAVAALLDARRLGLAPPRLLDSTLEREYAGCARCAVAEACVRGDSGFRLRLERWQERETRRSEPRNEPEAALWRLWRLPATTPATEATAATAKKEPE